MRQFERYLKLKHAIQNWLLGTGDINDISSLLNITSKSLDELFNWNGIQRGESLTNGPSDVQDIFNLIFLFYTQDNRTWLRKNVKRKA